MRGLRLDPLTHDLDVANITIDGEEATYQEIKTRLLSSGASRSRTGPRAFRGFRRS